MEQNALGFPPNLIGVAFRSIVVLLSFVAACGEPLPAGEWIVPHGADAGHPARDSGQPAEEESRRINQGHGLGPAAGMTADEEWTVRGAVGAPAVVHEGPKFRILGTIRVSMEASR